MSFLSSFFSPFRARLRSRRLKLQLAAEFEFPLEIRSDYHGVLPRFQYEYADYGGAAPTVTTPVIMLHIVAWTESVVNSRVLYHTT